MVSRLEVVRTPLRLSKMMKICEHYGQPIEDAAVYNLIHYATDGGKKGIDAITEMIETEPGQDTGEAFSNQIDQLKEDHGYSLREGEQETLDLSKRLFTDSGYREEKFREYKELILPNLKRVRLLDVLRGKVGERLPDLKD